MIQLTQLASYNNVKFIHMACHASQDAEIRGLAWRHIENKKRHNKHRPAPGASSLDSS